ncbi:hypothetical protein ACRAWD_27020 [Caulobacter segnis]
MGDDLIGRFIRLALDEAGCRSDRPGDAAGPAQFDDRAGGGLGGPAAELPRSRRGHAGRGHACRAGGGDLRALSALCPGSADPDWKADRGRTWSRRRIRPGRS